MYIINGDSGKDDIIKVTLFGPWHNASQAWQPSNVSLCNTWEASRDVENNTDEERF